MSDAATIDDALNLAHDLEEVFRLRAWARSYLYQVGELNLAEAVDVLQADAERRPSRPRSMPCAGGAVFALA
jgi:hypothetical protein